MPKKAKREISAESDNFISRPIIYSRGNRYVCHRKKTLKFRNEKGMPKKTKCEISAESDSFIFCPIFFSRENRYVCQRKKIFKSGMKRGCQKRLNAQFQLNPIALYFVLFSIPEKIAMCVKGRKFLIWE